MTPPKLSDSTAVRVETRKRPRHPEPSRCQGERHVREVAVATIIQERQRGNEDRHQRWARLERTDLFALGSVTKRFLCIPVPSTYECKTRGEERLPCGPRVAIKR